MQPRIRTIVLNHNGGQLVLDAIESVVACRWPAERHEIVVVDNASTDGSADALERRFPHISVRRNPRNTGFPANNLALTDLDGIDYVALVNPDCIVDPDWLSPLVAALERDPDLGAACPLIVFADSGLVQNAGSELLSNGYARDAGTGDPPQRYTEETDVFAWCGAAVVLRAAYLREVGLFDERYFLYYEDTDLAWRGARCGWRYRLVPSSRVRHHHSATVGVGSRTHQYYTERNRLVTLVKNAPLRVALAAVARFPLSTLSIATRGHDPRRALLRTRAFGGFAALLPHALRARRRAASTAP